MNDLTYLIRPKQVAVIGASRSPQKIGYAIIENIIGSGYKGEIYPVNPKEKEISGLKSYASVKEIGQKLDLAVICVPSAHVLGVAKECGEAKVKGLIVITAGFKEIGKEGLKREKKLVEICRKYNMRMVGPNCVGILNTHTPLNASFAKGHPEKGKVAFISQSGAMLISIVDWSYDMGLGFSSFISLGNKADLDETDFIACCADDPETAVILCYIEDVADGARFIDICSKASKKKPIIVLKSGTSNAGAQAAGSHTGALAGSDRAYEAAFKQSGVLRAGTMNELFDLARAFATQPLPHSLRVAIVTNSGGPAILATDAVENRHLKMARFSKKTADKLRQNLPIEANIYNPVDIIGDARNDRYKFAMETVLEDDQVDSLLVLLCPAALAEPEETAKTIVHLNKKYPDKPVMSVYMGGKSLAAGKKYLTAHGIPDFTFPESAVRAMKGMVRYHTYQNRAPSAEPLALKGINKEKVRQIIDQVFADKRVVLLGHEAAEVMAAYGIAASRSLLATSEDEAVRLAAEVGYPVAMKISSPRIAHKTDVGGVRLGIHSESEVRKAYQNIMERVRYFLPDAPIHGIEVQNMIDDGVEVIIGMSKDIQFGPLVVFGLGGIYVNLMEDVTFRLASALTSVQEAQKMITETKAYQMLKGYRGKKPADTEALTTAILRTARLVTDFGEITEMDINPVRVHTKGATALDVKITIERAKI